MTAGLKLSASGSETFFDPYKYRSIVVLICQDLGQLKRLYIKACGVEEIVAIEEGPEELRFHFAHLTFLSLISLTKLKCFYLEKHTLECPSLKTLNVYLCEALQMFSFGHLDSQYTVWVGEADLPIHQALFYVEKETPVMFLNDILERFPSTTTLQVRRSSFDTLFPSDEIVEHFRLRWFTGINVPIVVSGFLCWEGGYTEKVSYADIVKNLEGGARGVGRRDNNGSEGRSRNGIRESLAPQNKFKKTLQIHLDPNGRRRAEWVLERRVPQPRSPLRLAFSKEELGQVKAQSSLKKVVNCSGGVRNEAIRPLALTWVAKGVDKAKKVTEVMGSVLGAVSGEGNDYNSSTHASSRGNGVIQEVDLGPSCSGTKGEMTSHSFFDAEALSSDTSDTETVDDDSLISHFENEEGLLIEQLEREFVEEQKQQNKEAKFLLMVLLYSLEGKASNAIVKRKGSDTSSAIAKRPKLFLDNSAKERFESEFKYRGICAPQEVNFKFIAKEPELNVFHLFSQMGWKPVLAIKERIYPSLIREFYSNLVFSEEDGEPVGHSMIRGKKVELTADNIRSWIGVKKGDFKRYSSREPISMESYSTEKAAKKLGGNSNGEVTLAQLGVNERLIAHVLYQLIMPKAARAQGVIFEDEDWVGANVQGNYDQRLIQNMTFKKVGGKWIKLGKAKAEPGEGTEKRKMNVKHGKRPPKSTKGSGTWKSSRLLKKDTSSLSSPIQVSAEEKEESADSDATIYSESPIHQPIKEEPNEKGSDATLFSSAYDKEPNQDEHKAPPMTPLAEIREPLKVLTNQLAYAREEIYELNLIIIEMRAQQKEASMNKPTPLAIIPDQPSNA
ncbi:putative P-loop containing nucleoside triphosphate hydrolase, leucine-rich repeat domain, L [Senna tora]|uniref:Putative P-loop containing nucleoside triphosphate hydrolase, leucine-rich repeat domain, L n=1 Tax=Senna tora TaxID=362788 RepID=A0A834X6G4_9FABA|nr:putative P-loop containing nucleoside triphosphate hydrolase, leucine-rich repeat domain, L [Senna tora]